MDARKLTKLRKDLASFLDDVVGTLGNSRLYLNVFVLIVQSFLKVPALHDMAPNQTELPFVITQLVTLVVFALLAVAAAIKFRGESGQTA